MIADWNPDQKILEELVLYCKTRKNLDERDMHLSGNSYSAGELADEVERGTEVGQIFYKMYARHKGINEGTIQFPEV